MASFWVEVAGPGAAAKAWFSTRVVGEVMGNDPKAIARQVARDVRRDLVPAGTDPARMIHRVSVWACSSAATGRPAGAPVHVVERASKSADSGNG